MVQDGIDLKSIKWTQHWENIAIRGLDVDVD